MGRVPSYRGGSLSPLRRVKLFPDVAVTSDEQVDPRWERLTSAVCVRGLGACVTALWGFGLVFFGLFSPDGSMVVLLLHVLLCNVASFQEAVIGGLQSETTYSVTVAAYTTKGDGARSKAKVITTTGAGWEQQHTGTQIVHQVHHVWSHVHLIWSHDT